ncbi:MAG: hypothetical protein FWH37_03340 [Candidatus Bathyarchaeota archaeon]|nr:hypothetical protein [Candidatus Termiticorpusculum sp.]
MDNTIIMQLDLAMPIALCLVVLAALILSKRLGDKLTETAEQKEFKTRDVLLLVGFILTMVSVMAYASTINSGGIFENALLIFFLCTHTTLLFTFTHTFSNMTKSRVQLISIGFGTAAIIAGLVSLTGPFSDTYTIYRTIAFFGLATFCFGVTVFEQQRKTTKNGRWYMAAQPSSLFVLLFLFFNVLYKGVTQIWYPYLLDVFAFTFVIFMIIYIAPLFSWKSACVFAVLLTLIDICLVFIGPMVTVANTFTDLGIPAMVYLPNVPIVTQDTGSLLFRGLGLGDFFFAGVLAVQTFNKFGKKTALVSIVSMSVAFGVWGLFMLDLKEVLNIGGLPATVCIISGWIPIAVYKWFTTKNKSVSPTHITLPVETTNEQRPSQ